MVPPAPPAKNTSALSASGSAVAISNDPRVDLIHDADDHTALMLIDRGATPRRHLIVQESHDGNPS
jgi:hypothetical protein